MSKKRGLKLRKISYRHSISKIKSYGKTRINFQTKTKNAIKINMKSLRINQKLQYKKIVRNGTLRKYHLKHFIMSNWPNLKRNIIVRNNNLQKQVKRINLNMNRKSRIWSLIYVRSARSLCWRNRIRKENLTSLRRK